ncbi:MAG: elongation factor P [Deltaproteobacteria bacterium]|nr:elongation factor P [Deltaproteobacteria bacterium]
MMEVGELRKGSKLVLDGAPWVVAEYQFVKPGKGQALYKCKMKNMMTGVLVDRTYRSGEKFEKADLEENRMQFLYGDGEEYHFMNNESYEQFALPAEQVGDAANYLYENLDVDMLFFNGQPIGLTLPNFVVLQIEKSDPGIKGDTASNTTKPATLSTGCLIQVPLFLDEGEWIKVDTRSGEYVERVKK